MTVKEALKKLESYHAMDKSMGGDYMRVYDLIKRLDSDNKELKRELSEWEDSSPEELGEMLAGL